MNASVVLSDSEGVFLGEEEDATFCLSVNWVLFIDRIK